MKKDNYIPLYPIGRPSSIWVLPELNFFDSVFSSFRKQPESWTVQRFHFATAKDFADEDVLDDEDDEDEFHDFEDEDVFHEETTAKSLAWSIFDIRDVANHPRLSGFLTPEKNARIQV